MKVTKITIGRLYNLGNYEHVRYELTVEVPEGESAAQAFAATESTLETLNPHRPSFYLTKHQVSEAENEIARIYSLTDQECRRSYGVTKYARIIALKRMLMKRVRQSAEWDDARSDARIQLDNLGGVREFKDAKKDWSDDSEL